MKNYIIRNKDGEYLCKGPNSQWQRTQNPDFAERFAHEEAINVLNNCIGASFRHHWEIVPEENLCTFALNCDTNGGALGEFDWSAISQAQHQSFVQKKYEKSD